MNRSESGPRVRGARDLAALWRTLPAAVIRYPAADVPTGLGIATLSDSLRAWAWRTHCRAPVEVNCVDRGCSCVFADQGDCRADVLFPVRLGGGVPQWRMATLFLRWLPARGELHLIALGETACALIGSAARVLREHHGLSGGETLDVTCWADLELHGATRWQLSLVTPWIVSKEAHQPATRPDPAYITHELRKSIRTRAHKFTALCAREPTWQRLAGHLAHHVADALLPEAFTVEHASVEADTWVLGSRGNSAVFRALVWHGEVTLMVNPSLLPWLSVLAVCGGGENADKGFGGVELQPVDCRPGGAYRKQEGVLA